MIDHFFAGAYEVVHSFKGDALSKKYCPVNVGQDLSCVNFKTS
jgi:hypothetical protein